MLVSQSQIPLSSLVTQAKLITAIGIQTWLLAKVHWKTGGVCEIWSELNWQKYAYHFHPECAKRSIGLNRQPVLLQVTDRLQLDIEQTTHLITHFNTTMSLQSLQWKHKDSLKLDGQLSLTFITDPTLILFWYYINYLLNEHSELWHYIQTSSWYIVCKMAAFAYLFRPTFFSETLTKIVYTSEDNKPECITYNGRHSLKVASLNYTLLPKSN